MAFRILLGGLILQGFPVIVGLLLTSQRVMPKQKTHKGTKKRFRLTASGKAKHRQAGTSHLASRKVKKTRRKLRGTKVLSKSMLHQITKALGKYSS